VREQESPIDYDVGVALKISERHIRVGKINETIQKQRKD
jgi:hypothetical protein